jgi:hypothetical protein
MAKTLLAIVLGLIAVLAALVWLIVRRARRKRARD